MSRFIQPFFIAAFATVASAACAVGSDEPDDDIEAAEEDLEEVSLERGVLDGAEVLDDPSAPLGIYATANTVNTAIVYDDAERALLAKINAYRKQMGSPPVRASISETAAAHTESIGIAAEGGHSIPEDFDGPQFYSFGNTADAVFQRMDDATLQMITGTDYKRVGIARVKSYDGVWYWTVSMKTGTDAILSVGLTSIANNNKFEAANAYGWPMAFGAVRSLGKWFFYGPEGSVHFGSQGVNFAGLVGLAIVDATTTSVTATQVVRGAPRVRYRLSTMTRPANAAMFGTQSMQLHFLDKDFKKLGGTSVSTGVATTWHKITTGTVVSPAGTRFVRIVLGDTNKSAETGTFFYDNVRLEAF